MRVELKWITPRAEKEICEIARVSTTMDSGRSDGKLINYLIAHQHWSPFEMASACFYIECDRAVGRQILRHRSFSFQEFSQRYAEPEFAPYTEARVDGATNRQSSVEVDDPALQVLWEVLQENARRNYRVARENGIAKEVARALLPEGLTMSRMFMSGTIRSWLHYVELRTKEDTQKEHREIALAIGRLLMAQMSNVFGPVMPR